MFWVKLNGGVWFQNFTCLIEKSQKHFVWQLTKQLHQCKKYFKRHFYLQFSRANTKLATNAVPHGTLPGSAAHSSGGLELGAAEQCIAGISCSFNYLTPIWWWSRRWSREKSSISWEWAVSKLIFSNMNPLNLANLRANFKLIYLIKFPSN